MNNSMLHEREELIRMILSKHHKYSHIIEVGTGNGFFLSYLRQSINRSNLKYIGIDLCTDAIHDATKKYAGEGIDFISTSYEELANNMMLCDSDCVLVLTCHVLEFFSERELRDFYAIWHALPCRVFIASLEQHPNDNIASKGRMFNYFHNYEEILKDSGFTLIDKQVRYEQIALLDMITYMAIKDL